MLRMTVPYTKWLTISRGSKTEKSPAFSSLVKLSASGEDVGFIDEPTAVTDRYAVLTPTHHPFCCNVLLELVAWPYCYRKFNQGINFSYSQLEHIVFPETNPSKLDELEPLFRQIHYCELAEKELLVCRGGIMAFRDQMLDKMFPRN